jgi:radical SAM protein with 4Fe4S-binding SPASM domain
METPTLWQRLLWPQLPAKPEPVVPGLYHYFEDKEGQYTRFHLRVEPDGSGMLLANATTAARLSPAGVVIARDLLEGEEETAVFTHLKTRFKGTDEATMRADLQQVRAILQQLAAPDTGYPIINLADAHFDPNEAELFAPLEAEIPLAPPDQLVPLLDRLWEIGIPHATLLAPAGLTAEQHAHLVRAVERAEDLGMITGVRGRASDLLAGTLLSDLAMAGVDHVTIPLVAATAEIHDELFGEGDYTAVQKTITTLHLLEVCPVGEIPLLAHTQPDWLETLARLQEWGAAHVYCYAVAAPDEWEDTEALPATALRQIAAHVEETADSQQTPIFWEPPVTRDWQQTLAQQVQQGPRCTGDVAMRVEPDGRVIPPRGPYRSAGNILKDEWEQIWQDEAFTSYRQKVEAPTHCQHCPGLAICAAACPADPASWTSDGGQLIVDS